MLTVALHHLQTIRTHAEQAYPQECCGLLLGQLHERQGTLHKTLSHIQPTANTWEVDKYEFAPDQVQASTTRRYWVSPVELLHTQQYARSLGCDIIGVYHSHPDHTALPSECDRQWAWPQYSYVIVAVHGGHAHDLQSWMLDDHQVFQAEPLAISNPFAASVTPNPLEAADPPLPPH